MVFFDYCTNYSYCFFINLQKPFQVYLKNFQYAKYNFYSFEKSKHNNKNLHNGTVLNKKILIKGIHNKNFENKIRYSFDFINLEKTEGEISKQQINNLITKIKLSGFFTKVQLKSEIVNKTQIITINCKTTPILRQVCFINNKKLLISEAALKQIFIDQIGEPKNFKSIHKAISKIYKWYYDNGFQWVQIKVIEQKESPQAIHISILEGQIDSIQFKFPNNIFFGFYKEEIKSLKLIRQLFNLEEGQILNNKEIEQGLINLKDKNIFNNCDYSILPSTRETNKWNIVISLYTSPDKSTYLISKNISLLSEVVESIESQFFNSLNNLLWTYMKSHNVILPKFKQKLKKRSNNRKWFIQTIDNNNSQSTITNILTTPTTYFFTDLYEWYNNSSNFILKNDIRLKYNLCNLGSLNEYLTINFKLPNINQYTEIIYCKPWLNLLNKQTGFLKIRGLKQYINIRQKNIHNFLNQIFNYNLIISHLQSQVQYLKIQFNFKLNNKLNLRYIIGIQKNKYKQDSLKEQGEKFTSIIIKDLNSIKQEKNVFVYLTPETSKSAVSNFISLNTKLTYHTNNNCDIDWLGKGIYIMFMSKYYTPYQNFHNLNMPKYNIGFSQRTILKTTFYHTHSIHKKLLKGQFKMLDCEFGYLLGLPTFFPKSEMFELTSPMSIKNHSDFSINCPKLFAKSSCEYHLLLHRIHSVFMFVDVVYSRNREVLSSAPTISQLIFTNRLTKNNNFYVSSGVGYQFKTPIKKLPPIRIEYSINLDKKSQIYLRIGPILKSTAIENNL